MNAEPPEPGHPEPPALPAILLEPWPVIIVIAVGWLIAAILAFTVAGLQSGARSQSPASASAFSARRSFCGNDSAVRRGSRGAQSGLS